MGIKKICAFVVMPFSSEYGDVYELAIKAACEECKVWYQTAIKSAGGGCGPASDLWS
jgi:hypothetical protein